MREEVDESARLERQMLATGPHGVDVDFHGAIGRHQLDEIPSSKVLADQEDFVHAGVKRVGAG